MANQSRNMPCECMRLSNAVGSGAGGEDEADRTQRCRNNKFYFNSVVFGCNIAAMYGTSVLYMDVVHADDYGKWEMHSVANWTFCAHAGISTKQNPWKMFMYLFAFAMINNYALIKGYTHTHTAYITRSRMGNQCAYRQTYVHSIVCTCSSYEW